LHTSPGLANSKILIKDIKPNNEAYKMKREQLMKLPTSASQGPTQQGSEVELRHVGSHSVSDTGAEQLRETPPRLGLQGVQHNQQMSTPHLPYPHKFNLFKVMC
jgi:hypothetical protein